MAGLLTMWTNTLVVLFLSSTTPLPAPAHSPLEAFESQACTPRARLFRAVPEYSIEGLMRQANRLVNIDWNNAEERVEGEWVPVSMPVYSVSLFLLDVANTNLPYGASLAQAKNEESLMELVGEINAAQFTIRDVVMDRANIDYVPTQPQRLTSGQVALIVVTGECDNLVKPWQVYTPPVSRSQSLGEVATRFDLCH